MGETKLLPWRDYWILMAQLAIDITDEELVRIMDVKVDLSNSFGMAVVAYAHTGLVDEYKNNPRVLFIDCKSTKGDELESVVPSNTKAVILTDGLPQYHSTWLTSFARRKNIPFLIRKTNQAVYDTLKSFFPNGNGSADTKITPAEAKETQTKGKLQFLIPHIDFTKSNTENAKILMRMCVEKGIATTEGSLAQLISIQRRKGNQTAVPRSVRNQLDVSVEMLDNMIKDLGAMRDYLIQTTEENRLLKAKVDKFKKALDE